MKQLLANMKDFYNFWKVFFDYYFEIFHNHTTSFSLLYTHIMRKLLYRMEYNAKIPFKELNFAFLIACLYKGQRKCSDISLHITLYLCRHPNEHIIIYKWCNIQQHLYFVYFHGTHPFTYLFNNIRIFSFIHNVLSLPKSLLIIRIIFLIFL